MNEILISTCCILLIELCIIYTLMRRIFAQTQFHYFDRNTWLLIIILGNIIGQVAYIVFEKETRL